MEKNEELKILIPKGRIFENVARLFDEAGLELHLSDRTYRPVINAFGDEKHKFAAKIMKPQNVGELLELGSHDAGFTGIDWIKESNADVEEILDLGFDRVRIVAAVPLGFDIEELKKRRIVVATEYSNLAKNWLTENGFNYRLLRTYGATEVFPPDDADMIIDNTSSGKTLNENGLKIITTIMESSTRFAASKTAMENPEKRRMINELKMLFKAVLDGRERVMLEMNVSEDDFDDLVSGLPAMKSPTVSPLTGSNGFAVKIAVKKGEVPGLILRLKELGAVDIVEYDLRKVVP